MFRIEHNVKTGEVVEIEMTTDEIADHNTMIELANEQRKKIADDLESQANKNKAARQALLDKLGITEDEAKLLLGGN